MLALLLQKAIGLLALLVQEKKHPSISPSNGRRWKPDTQFTCFNTTTVQILTLEATDEDGNPSIQLTYVTTDVQILTPEELRAQASLLLLVLLQQTSYLRRDGAHPKCTHTHTHTHTH